MEETNPLAEPYFNEQEREWIRNTFKDNATALKTLRKFLIPTLNNNAPIGQLDDMWIETADVLTRMAPGDRELVILARVKTIQHIDGCLAKLALIAQTKEESKEQKKARIDKDSSQ